MALARASLQPDTVWAWRQCVLRSELSPDTRLVLLAIAHRMRDGSDTCLASPRQLAIDAALPFERVSAALREAVDSGYLEIFGADGRQLCLARRFPIRSA